MREFETYVYELVGLVERFTGRPTSVGCGQGRKRQRPAEMATAT